MADSQNKDASAPIDTQTPVEAEVFTEKPTEAATEPLTEAPTESYVDAYRGYLEVLENHKSDIEAYDWQLGDDESRPVVFADIAGDETPEMIVVCCNPTLSTTVSSFLNIFQYKDNSVKQVYSMDNSKTDGFFQLDYNGPGGLNIGKKRLTANRPRSIRSPRWRLIPLLLPKICFFRSLMKSIKTHQPF